MVFSCAVWSRIAWAAAGEGTASVDSLMATSAAEHGTAQAVMPKDARSERGFILLQGNGFAPVGVHARVRLRFPAHVPRRRRSPYFRKRRTGRTTWYRGKSSRGRRIEEISIKPGLKANLRMHMSISAR